MTKTESSTASPVAERPGGVVLPERSLFGPEPVRVRDLVGEIAAPKPPLSSPGEIVVTPARRGGPLRLSWYDYGMVALIVASMIAGVICLLRGV